MKLVNISNNGRIINLFIRNDKGELEIREVKDFFSYYYEINDEGTFKSFDGKPLKKIFTTKPSDVRKSRTDTAYEADIIFTRRYMIDKVDKLEKCSVKIAYIDIEITAPELPNTEEAKYPVSCISVGNSFTRNIKTFWIKNYKTEFEMIEAFIQYMQQEKFDLWLSWNVAFDYNYLHQRVPDFPVRISPIGQSRYGDGKVEYPCGISIVDYLQWFKKVTLNREESYALDHIAQVHLGEKTWGETEFNVVNERVREKNINDIKRMVKIEEKFKIVDFFDEIRRLSKVEWEDMIWFSRVLDMLLLEEAKNQKIVLPMKPAEERGTLEEKTDYAGAFREAYQTGSFWDYTSYDLTSAYPNMIADFCLDPSNCLNVVHKDSPALKIENSYFIQNPNAILPKVVKKLMIKKQEIKNKLENTKTDTPEYKDLKVLYKSVKSIANSAYGVFGNRFFRMYDSRVASATTYLVRDLLKYIISELEKLDYKVIYVDTDGIIVNTKENLTDLLNNLVNSWAKKYGKENINTKFEYEGIFRSLVILALCRYEGLLEKPNGEKELKRVGLEIKRKDSTVYMKQFQATLLKKIREKENKDNIITWIKNEINNLKNQPLENIAFPCKVSKKLEDYKNMPIFLRALTYAQELNPEFKKPIGEKYFYIYTKPFGYEKTITEKELIMTYAKTGQEKGYKNLTKKRLETASAMLGDLTEEQLRDKGIIKLKKISSKGKQKNVIAFDKDNKSHINKENIDWKLMTQRNLLNKLDVVFEAMGWDISAIIPKKAEITPKNTPKTRIRHSVSEEKSKDKGQNTPVKKENKPKSTQPIENKEVIENPCDLDQCKSNKNGICTGKGNPELCPKNNDQSIYEKEELLKEKPKIEPFYSE